MFTVKIASLFDADVNSDYQCVFQHERIEPCVEFALALHRSSNVPHVVDVVSHPFAVSTSDDVVCLTLTLKNNSLERK